MQTPIPEGDFSATSGVEVAEMLNRSLLSGSWPQYCRPAPDGYYCSCGRAWSSMPETSAVRAGETSRIFSLGGFVEAKVFHVKCTQCGNKLSYDGFSEAIFNLDNINLFSHELLRL